MMELKGIKISDISNTDRLHKSAIIYRDDSSRFIYVCFHCGRMFNEINETLQHIESHFQVANIEIDQFTEDAKEDNLVDLFAAQTVDIKIEILDNNDDCSAAPRSNEPVHEDENGETRYRERYDKVMKKISNRISSANKVSAVKESRREATKKRVYTSPYRCHKCSQCFRYMNALRSHLNKHTDYDLLAAYKCKECDCYYRNAFALRVHILGVHLMVKRFSCNACALQFEFSQDERFEEHLKQHNTPDNKLWTNIKEGIYHKTSDFTQYEEIESFTEEKHSCEFCTQKFYIKCNLDVHMKSVHSSQRRLQCGQCDSIFTAPKQYFAHQLEHQRVGQNIVERDEDVLLAKLDACIDERIIHEENEFSEHPYRCLICNTAFDARHDIRKHIRERHVYKMFPPPMEPKKEFICDLCGKLLKSKTAMETHLNIHTNTKSHPCKICGKTFRRIGDRNIHERQHTGEKPFQCHECGKAFISKGLLTAHKKSHDDTTYPCPICGKAFNLPSGYRKHIQTHRQDRPFKCTICTKSFNTRIYLGKHMEVHSDKQYQCRFCDSKFNTSNGQRQHQRHKHSYTSV